MFRPLPRSMVARVVVSAFFKQKTAYEIIAGDGVQTCALPISIAPNVARTVTFRFNAALEQSFFRAILIGPNKEQRELEVTPGKDTTEEIIKLPPLKPGKYGISYKALASDSHLTEAVLRFTVADSQ